MELLKDKIKKEGRVTEDNILMVDSFLNHQMDVEFFNKVGKEFKDRFKNDQIDKILTIESTGIGLGIITAQYFDNVPVVFGKKIERLPRNKREEVFNSEVYSFTKKTIYNVVVDKKFIKPGEKILIVDDFLANACAVFGLIDVVKQAGAEVVGVGIVIEKGFQSGRAHLEDKGIRVESLVTIDKIEDGEVYFK
ncbi:MAG: xanthine phosphoribosyltransferase [Clostridium perfringens]